MAPPTRARTRTRATCTCTYTNERSNVPAVGSQCEPGPAEILAGMVLVAPPDVEAPAARLDQLLGDADLRERLGMRVRETVRRAFTWEPCGRATAAYEDVLR